MTFLTMMITTIQGAIAATSGVTGRRNALSSELFAPSVQRNIAMKTVPKQLVDAPTAVKRAIVLLPNPATNSKGTCYGLNERKWILSIRGLPPVELLSYEDVTEISPNDLDNKLEQFGARILKMVDLRISTAMQHLEQRLIKHFDSLMTSINYSLCRVDKTMATGSHAPQKRVRRPLPTTSDFNSSATDIEIDDNEKYVRAIIAEQSKVCSKGVNDLIRKG
ncbi:hypothetical protein ACOME3_005077 [Neoechinorhynchus agilis]